MKRTYQYSNDSNEIIYVVAKSIKQVRRVFPKARNISLRNDVPVSPDMQDISEL